MTYDWLIVRSEMRQEQALARRIEAMGCAAWVPMEVRFHRVQLGAKKQPRIWETPILATVLFASVPRTAWGDLMALEGYRDLERPSPSSAPYTVPHGQLVEFRSMVDRENTIRRRQFMRRQEGKRGKRTLKLGDPHTFAALMDELFGLKADIEKAA